MTRFKIHHVGKVVEDIDSQLDYYVKLGFKVDTKIKVDKFQKVRVGTVTVGDFIIELLEPIDSTSPVWNFLKKGGGIHHLCFQVKNVDTYLSNLIKNNGGFQISSVTLSVFNHRKVAFFSNKDRDIFEIIESV